MTITSVADGINLNKYPSLPTQEQWQRICQVLSDLSTTYQMNQPDVEMYDNCGDMAHNICVDLHIPYGDPNAEEDEEVEPDLSGNFMKDVLDGKTDEE